MKYFANFPRTLYQVSGASSGKSAEYVTLTDITRNVRFKREVLDQISLYDEMIIRDDHTFERISEELYGSPYYHWVVMLLNDRYDYVNDFPLSSRSFEEYIEREFDQKIAFVATFSGPCTFQPGQTITGRTSGTKADVADAGGVLAPSQSLLHNVTGEFNVDEIVCTGTSQSMTTITSIEPVNYIDFRYGRNSKSLLVDVVTDMGASIDVSGDIKVSDKVTGAPSIIPAASVWSYDRVFDVSIKQFVQTSIDAGDRFIDSRNYLIEPGQFSPHMPVFLYDQQYNENERKREIRVISEQMLQIVLKNFKDLM
jgi:hypothetical protein